MESVITFLISTIVQSIADIYFIEKMSSLIEKKNHTKKQIFITGILVFLIVIISQLIKNYIPLINIFIMILFISLTLHWVMEISFTKTFFISILMSAFMAITELITVFLVTNILQCNTSYLLERQFKMLLIILPQSLFSILLTKILFIIFYKKNDKFTKDINNISHKQIIPFIVLLLIYIFPQMILMIINTYSYSGIFLLINTLQFILIFIFLSIYLKKSIEYEKTQMDLYTSELHNKTLIGMVDGVRTLKHDYNNIMQALNGYVTTKQYDKLAEHINSVIGECNMVNNLSVIDPKIFNEPAVYGIVGAKYFLANKDNIPFDLDILSNIAKIDFPKPDLSRILGILLDNALEATKKSNKPYIRLEMKFDKRKNSDIIRVINSYDLKNDINLTEIYKKGYSTKEVKSGIGLWEVKKLIDKSKNSQIFATIEKDKFVQNITIEKTE